MGTEKSKYLDLVSVLYKEVRKAGLDSSAQNIKSDHHAVEYWKYSFLLKEYCSANSVILDWGALFGHVTLMGQALGLNVVPFVFGADQKLKDLHKTALTTDVVYSDDPVRLPFEDSTFDTVISSGVFEHAQEEGGDPVKTLREIKRILKPEGFFILWKLPNASGLAEIKSDILGAWSHPYRYTPNGIKILLNSNGFELVHFDYDDLFPLGVKALLRSLRLGGINWVSSYLARKPVFRVFSNDFVVVAQSV